MLGELTSKIKLYDNPGAVALEEVVREPRLVRKQLEVPLAMRGRDPLLVGRDESLANLVIPDSYISRTHAAIFQEEGDYYLQDLHSKNGTYLNGVRLASGERSSRPLENGDRLRFNEVEFEFVLPQE